MDTVCVPLRGEPIFQMVSKTSLRINKWCSFLLFIPKLSVWFAIFTGRFSFRICIPVNKSYQHIQLKLIEFNFYCKHGRKYNTKFRRLGLLLIPECKTEGICLSVALAPDRLKCYLKVYKNPYCNGHKKEDGNGFQLLLITVAKFQNPRNIRAKKKNIS